MISLVIAIIGLFNVDGSDIHDFRESVMTLFLGEILGCAYTWFIIELLTKVNC